MVNYLCLVQLKLQLLVLLKQTSIKLSCWWSLILCWHFVLATCHWWILILIQLDTPTDGFLPLIPAFLIYSIFLGLLIYLIVLIGAVLVFTMLFYPFLIFVLLAVLIGIVYLTVRLSLSEMILSDLILDFSGNYSDKKELNLLQKVMFSLKESWRLTKGQFWFLIVLGLSLIGWYFLVIISAGLAIVFVGPYFMAINATLYKHLIDSYKE